jgi:AAA family ATP:ADP antiporter
MSSNIPGRRGIALASRLLGIQPDEFGRGALLFAYLCLVVGSFVAGKAARDALFLYRFSALQLPYVDIGVAVLVGAWVALYVRIGRRVSLRTLLNGSLLFFAGNAVFFWAMSRYSDAAWVLPIVYIWVGMFGVIAPAQVWTLANFVLTTREAKRLVALIGSGASVGAIGGGFIVQRFAMTFGAEATLLAMAAALVVSMLLVDQIWRRRPTSPARAGAPESRSSREKDAPTGLRASARVIARSPYLTAIAAVICLSSFATAIAAWQFKAAASAALPDQDALAAFFGSFYLYTGAASLALQWLLTSRLLRRVGLGFTLFVVPVALTAGTLTFAVTGAFAAIIALRGADQMLRYSIDRPTVELLYLPVPPEQTFQAKSFIDTVVWRLGDALSGLTVLLFAVGLHWSAVHLSWVNLLLLGGWLAAAWAARRLYVAELSDSILSYRLDAERARTRVMDRTATDILASQLSSADPKQILFALEQFDAVHPGDVHPAVRGLLTHPSPEVRTAAVAALDRAGDRAALVDIERLLYDKDLGVRTEALLFIAHHARIDPLERIEQLGNFEDFSIRSAMISFLARPGPSQNLEAAHVMLAAMVREHEPRTLVEAARLLQRLPPVFDDELGILLASGDAEVLRHAILAAGRAPGAATVSRLIELLADPDLAGAAADALALHGDGLVPMLRERLEDPATPPAVRQELPAVLQQIGSPGAEAVLTDNLLDPDTVLRFRVITALNRLRAPGSSRPLDVKLVETVLAAEIMGHLRSYQILGTLGGRLDRNASLTAALRDSMTQEVERIFRLLKLLWPQYDLHSAFVGLQSDNRAIHDNALEFLENVLQPSLRALLVPLLDSAVSIGRRVELANQTLGTTLRDREEAVELLARSPDPWLQSCAAYAIGAFSLRSLAPFLDVWQQSDDALLKETAAQAARALAAEAKRGS